MALPILFGAAPPSVGNVAIAPSAAPVQTAPTVKHARGLLWKIERPGVKASHLFGTIHSDDPRVTALPAPVTRTLDASDHFVMEAVIDGESMVYMAEAMFYNDGQTLEQVIGKKLYAESKQALVARGIPTLSMEKQKPWAIMMVLSMPPPQTGEFVDLMLQARAARQNKPVSGLETISEQLEIFDLLPLSHQIALLEETVRSQAGYDKELEALIQAYLARDLAMINTISEKSDISNKKISEDVTDRLITRRNSRMADRILPILKNGNAFIAVGAAHLPGSSGLLILLENAGYRVTPVY